MEKRRAKRLTDNLDAEILAGNTTYSGIIMNLSESGLYMVTATSSKVVDISTDSTIELNCKLPSGETLKMKCEVKWFQTKTSPHGASFSMGMEILDPPANYKKFLKSLR
ncbi:MAG: PilZ domain-containing protein [Nitrospirae bacterium]|nr:PilZ domain-containing protein [Nitrospirota bacterium]